MHHWMNDAAKAAYEHCKRDIRQRGYPNDEIHRMEVEKLSMPELKTTSARIQKMIERAFLAGELDGIKLCDSCFHEFSPSGVKKI